MDLRIIFLTTNFEEVTNGPGIFARYLWDAFRDDPEIEFHVVAPNFRQEHPRLHASGQGRSSRDLYNRACRLADLLSVSPGPPTILHSNNTYILATLRMFRGPILAQVNDYEVAEVWTHPRQVWRQHGVRRLLSLIWRHHREASLFRRPIHWICNSEYTRRRVLEAYRCDPNRITVIYKAIQAGDFFRSERLPPDPLPGRSRGARLIVVGSNWRLKGVPELLAALALVRRVIPYVHLTVAGPHRPQDLESLRRLSRQNRILEQVSFPGLIDRSQLPVMLWHSDVFVLPTHQEAFGVAIIEAMAAGLPVVASEVGGVPEIIRNSSEGELVKPGDVKGLAEAIVRVLSDEKRRESLARVGPARAADFMVNKMVDKIRCLYLSITCRKSENSVL